jgi:hypothetical protein
MSVELSVLESLGINLYSNAAAVLSELVANAYDADANTVSIDWKNGSDRVVVSDDGCGMNVAQLNARFLKAGYKKREHEGLSSPKFNRPFMGRKGIGKLSVFSIARIITVYSKTKDGGAEGLSIRADELEERIKNDQPYHPSAVQVPAEYDLVGTTIVLEELKTTRASITAAALRKRLARRFDVMDKRRPEDGGFQIVVNGKPLTYADRQELKKLDFIWEFGSPELASAALPDSITRRVIANNVVDAGSGWKVTGWFGAVRKPTDLTTDEEAGSLKNVIVIARGRPIQEGIVDKLDFNRMFVSYVTGQIHADFLDLDESGYEDIATSDRQRLMEDDERVRKLQAFLRQALVDASTEWAVLRSDKEAGAAIDQYPKIAEWVEGLPEWQRPAARKMIGTIASLRLEGKNQAEDRTALFRAGILAFQRVGLRESAEALENLSNVTAVDLLPILGQQDEYEAALWGDILRSRINAIEKLQEVTSSDEKEKVLQEHLWNHLWLLDPSWERPTADAALEATMEENLKNVEPDFTPLDHSGNEIRGRMDIRYRNVMGNHIIVELKRYSVKADLDDLAAQGAKYAEAMASILRSQQRESEVGRIEVMFVLGSKPTVKSMGSASDVDEVIRHRLSGGTIKGDYRTYDALIHQAKTRYADYLDRSAKVHALEKLLGEVHEVSNELDEPEPSEDGE